MSKIYRTGLINSRYLRREVLRLFRPAATRPEHDRVSALDAVSMCVASGEAVGVVGRNGSGKSTLLKLISGVTLPTTGEIEVRGRLVSLLDIGTGFSGDLSARENIFLNGAILGMKRREIIERFDTIVEFSGIGRFLDTPVKRFSSGMYIRLGFAIAIHCAADIMLIDEVLAAADRKFLEQCRDRLRERVAEGVALVVVSHNLHTIRDLCSRAILLDKGAVAAEGSTAEVLSRYRKG